MLIDLCRNASFFGGVGCDEILLLEPQKLFETFLWHKIINYFYKQTTSNYTIYKKNHIHSSPSSSSPRKATT